MNRDVQGLFLIAGKLTAFVKQTRSISDEKRYLEKLFLWCSFRLSEKNEKDKKRKGLTPVSATPTHMLRICVNPSFKHLLSPRGDSCEQSAPTVPQLLNHGYRFETLKRRLGFAAVPCRAMANLAVQVWVRIWCEHSEIGFVSAIYSSNTSSVAVNRATFCPSLGAADRVCSANRSIPHRRRLIKPITTD